MIKLENLTDYPKQNFGIILETGEKINFSLEYEPVRKSWLYSVGYKDIIINNRNLIVSPNTLRQFRNILPFGVLVYSMDKLDPSFLTDFVNGRIEIYILNQSEIDYVESDIYGYQ
jgi:hypothetical protein